MCMALFYRDTLFTHIKRCPLRGGRKIKEKRAYEDGTLLIEPFLPVASTMQVKVQKLIGGMRDTQANEGLYSGRICKGLL